MPALELRLRDGVEAHGTLLHFLFPVWYQMSTGILIAWLNSNAAASISVTDSIATLLTPVSSRRSPRRLLRRSPRRSPSRRSPKRRTGRRFRAAAHESVKLTLPCVSKPTTTGSVIYRVPGQTMTIEFTDFPTCLSDDDIVRISGRGNWKVESVHPNTNAIVFRPVDVADVIPEFQTASVSGPPPAVPLQTASGSEPLPVVPLQRDSELFSSRNDDVEFDELDPSIVPGENREVLASHTSTTGSTRQSHTPSSSYDDHPTTPTMRRSAGPRVQAPVPQRRHSSLADTPNAADRNAADRSRSPRSTGP